MTVQAVADPSARAEDVPTTAPTFLPSDGESATSFVTPVVRPSGIIWKRNAEKFRIWARTPVIDGPSTSASSLAVMMARMRFEIAERLRIPAEKTNDRSPKKAGTEGSAATGPGTSSGSESGGDPTSGLSRLPDLGRIGRTSLS